MAMVAIPRSLLWSATSYPYLVNASLMHRMNFFPSFGSLEKSKEVVVHALVWFGGLGQAGD
jgi:hypothetical protein